MYHKFYYKAKTEKLYSRIIQSKSALKVQYITIQNKI